MKRLSLLVVLALVACPERRIPEHLRPPDPTQDTAVRELRSVDDVVAAWVDNDPLGRTAGRLSPEQLGNIDGAEPYIALLNAANALDTSSPGALQAVAVLEREHRGTPIVALARGARLRLAEGYAGGNVDERVEGEILGLVTPVPPPREVGTLPLRAMAWLPREPTLRDAILTLGDRWVLAGWLDGPAIDLDPVSDALNAPPYDALRRTPLARIVLARAAGVQGPTAAGIGDLERATRMVLEASAAAKNRDKERIAAKRAALKAELDVTGDPIDALLARAAERLIDASGSDLGAGGALLAVQARRLNGGCDDVPCVGLDRVDGIVAAGRWDPSLDRLAALWKVAALKQGLDGLEVARGTVRYPAAVVDLVDALTGAGATPPDAIVLLQRSPDSATWLALARSVGAEQATTWEDARTALEAFTLDQATSARRAEPNAEVRATLDSLIRQLTR